MYRAGMPSPKIAATKGMAESTVRYHLFIAVQADPEIRDEHKSARGKVTRQTSPGLRNLQDTVAFFRAEKRLPATGGNTARERALGSWLHRRRQAAADGTLSALYRDGLAVIPNWDTQPTRNETKAARWDQRLSELAGYTATGNDWPRHKNPSTEQERVLGVWLHVQRISRRHHKLALAREEQLNTVLPGWQEGRPRSGGQRSSPG